MLGLLHINVSGVLGFAATKVPPGEEPSTFAFAPLTFVVSASVLLVSAGVVDMPSLFAD